jgi:hypothetical protein
MFDRLPLSEVLQSFPIAIVTKRQIIEYVSVTDSSFAQKFRLHIAE